MKSQKDGSAERLEKAAGQKQAFWATKQEKNGRSREDEEEKESRRASERDDDGDGGEESTRTGSSNKDGWPAMTYSPSRLQIIKSQRAT